jgi:hypothetical protein
MMLVRRFLLDLRLFLRFYDFILWFNLRCLLLLVYHS